MKGKIYFFYIDKVYQSTVGKMRYSPQLDCYHFVFNGVLTRIEEIYDRSIDAERALEEHLQLKRILDCL